MKLWSSKNRICRNTSESQNYLYELQQIDAQALDDNNQEMAGPTKGYQCILCHVYVLYAALCILYPVYNIQPYTYCTDTAVGLYSVHL